MIRLNNSIVAVASQITHYKKGFLHETKYFKSATHLEYVRGGFWNALFHLDFSKKEVTSWYSGYVDYLRYIGNWNDLEKWIGYSGEYQIIDDKIYESPYITIYLSDGKNYTAYFKTNNEMKKMEQKIIRKIRKVDGR